MPRRSLFSAHRPVLVRRFASTSAGLSLTLFAGCLTGDVSETELFREGAERELVGTTLEVEDGARTGTLDRPWGAVLDGAGDSVCWDRVDLNGAAQISVRYSSGEGFDDSLDVRFEGASIGRIELAYCDVNGAWEGDCGEATGDIAARSGAGRLCLVGQGPGWIGALDRATVADGGDGIDSFVLRSHRGRFVSLGAGGYLEWTAGSAAQAEVFRKVEQQGTQFKLQATSSGAFVSLDGNDELVAGASQAGAARFDAPLCAAIST